jgi:hypothetical protein
MSASVFACLICAYSKDAREGAWHPAARCAVRPSLVLVDPKAVLYLLGTEMDYNVDRLTSKFVFNNPNQKNTCGRVGGRSISCRQGRRSSR